LLFVLYSLAAYDPALTNNTPNTHNTTTKNSGRCSYTAALGAEGLAVAFGPGGSTYALLAPHAATLHDARGAGPLLGRVESDGVVKFTALGAARADER
jgi:hypothetical protein